MLKVGFPAPPEEADQFCVSWRDQQVKLGPVSYVDPFDEWFLSRPVFNITVIIRKG